MAANFTVTKAGVDIKAVAKAKVYGDTDPDLIFEITSGTLAFEDAFSGKLVRESGENVGKYGILIGSVSLSNNYNLTFTSKDLTINPIKVQVTADARTKVYGAANPALTFTSVPEVGSGLTNGEVISFSGELSREPGEDVGDFSILQNSLANSNYTLEYKGAYLTITLTTGFYQLFEDKPGMKVYPNPFTDRVEFDLKLQADADVRLEVYSITGIRLASLVNERLKGSRSFNIVYVPQQQSNNIQIYKLIIDGVVTQTGILIHR